MNYRSRPAWRVQWLSLLFQFILLTGLLWVFWFVIVNNPAPWQRWSYLLAVFCFVVLALPILYRRYAWRYAVDNENIESRYGIIARKVQSIRIQDLRNVNVRQGFFQRIFGIGDVEFSSAGGGGVEVEFRGITSPLELKEQVQELQDRFQQGD